MTAKYFIISNTGITVLTWCVLLCLVANTDGLFFGRNFRRRYGGPNPKLHPPTGNLPYSSPGSYAHKLPLHGGRSRYHYPVRPQIINYQHAEQLQSKQRAKMLNIMLDHSGHVDSDSLFPAAHQIPTVFIPSNAPALAPPIVVGYGLYDQRQPSPPHAHLSMLHPSYESSFTQHHHNEISYFDNPPPQNYKYPLPYPVKNYVASDSYSQVVHNGGNHVTNLQPPHLAFQNRPMEPMAPVHHPPPPGYHDNVNVVDYIQQLSPTYMPGHFSHNNPLGALPCCNEVPWKPVETVQIREHRLHGTTRHPMSMYLPHKHHEVEAESRPLATIISLSHNQTMFNTTPAVQSNGTAVLNITMPQIRPAESGKNATSEEHRVKNVTDVLASTSILMLSPQNVTTSPPKVKSRPKVRNNTSQLGVFLASITKLQGNTSIKWPTMTTVSVSLPSTAKPPSELSEPAVAGSSSDVVTTNDDLVIASTRPVSTGTITRRPPTRSPPVRAPPVQSDDIFGIPGDIGASDGAAADAGGETGGSGMVNIFTQFLDELANIIEQFSPSTDLPGVGDAPGLGSEGQGASSVGESVGNPGVGSLPDAPSVPSEAVGEVGGDIAGGLPEAPSGPSEVAGDLAGGADPGTVANAGNEVPASSQVSFDTTGFSQFPLRQQAALFEGMPIHPQFASGFNNFDTNDEEAAAEGFHFGESSESISHAESEPFAEASTDVHDHFIEIPISELVPHPSFIRNNLMINPFSQAEPHPVVTSHGRPKDFEVDHFASEDSSGEDQSASATESNYEVGSRPLNADETPKKLTSPVSNHIEVTTPIPGFDATGDDNSPKSFQGSATSEHPFIHNLAKSPELVSQAPEIIAFSSTVSHFPAKGTKGGRSNEKVPEKSKHQQALASFNSQNKNALEDEDDDARSPHNHIPKPNIEFKGQIGELGNTHNDINAGHTEQSIEFPEISTIRDYHSRNYEAQWEKEEENVPDAEGIPSHILSEVQTNINLDLLRTGHNNNRRNQ